MRALQTSIGLTSALLLTVTVVTATAVAATGAEAQNPADFTSDIQPEGSSDRRWNLPGRG